MPVIITESAEQAVQQPEETPDASEPEASPELSTEPETTAQPNTTGNPEQTEKSEEQGKNPESERPVSASGVTNKNGKVTVPPLNEDITGDDGNGDITETKPGEDTDGDGEPDTEDTETIYKVTVSNKDGNIANALVKIEDGRVTVTLPDTYTLTTSNQTTVTVLDKDGKPVQGVSVTIKDKSTEKSDTTNSQGKVTLPVKSTGGGGGGSLSGGGGGGFVSSSTMNVKVVDKDGKTVSVSKSISNNDITLTLPAGTVLDGGNYYTITVTDRNGKALSDVDVTLKDRKDGSATGKTDKDGMLILPGKKHKAYIVGYPDGTFQPDGNMTRAEAAAIFARLIADEKGESINGKSTFEDVKTNEWYASYIGYLEKYEIIKGYTDGMFRPEGHVTRSEFVSMAVRYYSLFNNVNKAGYTVNYTDLEKNNWAYADIAFAKHIGWLNGYSDGSFRGENNITRAEVVTVTNRATGRLADKDYVKDNFTRLNRFTDVNDSSLWYFFDVAEAANDHIAVTKEDNEIWAK